MDVSNKELVAIVGSVGSGKVFNSLIFYNIENKNKKIIMIIELTITRYTR